MHVTLKGGAAKVAAQEAHSSASNGDGLQRRPTKALVDELLLEGQHLIREEVHLAKIQIRDEAKKVGKGAGAVGGAGIAAHTALLCFAACLVLALAGVMKAWVAALIVTVLFAGAAAGLFFWGRQRLKEAKPTEVVQNLQEEKQWMKDTLYRVKSHTHANA